jgi:hypothetical protein
MLTSRKPLGQPLVVMPLPKASTQFAAQTRCPSRQLLLRHSVSSVQTLPVPNFATHTFETQRDVASQVLVQLWPTPGGGAQNKPPPSRSWQVVPGAQTEVQLSPSTG